MIMKNRNNNRQIGKDLAKKVKKPNTQQKKIVSGPKSTVT